MEGKQGSEGTNSAGEGQQNSGEGSVSIEELQAQLAALKATNERVLKEAKEAKAQKRTLQEQLEKIQLGEDGERQPEPKPSASKDKQLDFYKKQAESYKAQLEATRKTTLKAQIKAQVARFAPDAVDLDDLLNQPKFSHLLEGGVDEESLSLSEDAAKAYVAEVYKAKPWMKKAGNQVGVVNKPSRSGAQNLNGKGVKEMANDELFKLAISGKL